MYKDALTSLKNQTKVVDSFKHIAYADDHITIVVIKVQINTQNSKINKIIKLIADKCRSLLDLATRAAGCGINPDKSELIVAARYKDCHEIAKD